jgi:hypothetical protein
MDDCEDLNEIAVGELRDTKLEELTDGERFSIKDSYPSNGSHDKT